MAETDGDFAGDELALAGWHHDFAAFTGGALLVFSGGEEPHEYLEMIWMEQDVRVSQGVKQS